VATDTKTSQERDEHVGKTTNSKNCIRISELQTVSSLKYIDNKNCAMQIRKVYLVDARMSQGMMLK